MYARPIFCGGVVGGRGDGTKQGFKVCARFGLVMREESEEM